MGTPTDSKTIRVSNETHKRLMSLAADINGTADDALSHLLGLSTVRVPVSEVQRERWTAYANAQGVSIAEWVKLRVEAAIQYGTDQGTMHVVLDHVRALASAAGVRVTRTQPRKYTTGTRE
jgi:hypothetical protein